MPNRCASGTLRRPATVLDALSQPLPASASERSQAQLPPSILVEVGHGRGASHDSILGAAVVLGDLPVAPGSTTAFWTAADRSLRILQRTSASPAASTGSSLTLRAF